MGRQANLAKTYTDDQLLSLLRKGNEVFVEWQREFAHQFADHCRVEHRVPTLRWQLDKLEELTHEPWTEKRLSWLRESGLFKTYVAVLRERGERALTETALKLALDAGEDYLPWALKRAKQDDNYEAIPKIVAPIVSLATPRKGSVLAQKTNITVTMGPKAQAVLANPITVEVEAEQIEVVAEPVDD